MLVVGVVATIQDVHVSILNTFTYLYHSYRVHAPIVLAVVSGVFTSKQCVYKVCGCV